MKASSNIQATFSPSQLRRKFTKNGSELNEILKSNNNLKEFVGNAEVNKSKINEI